MKETVLIKLLTPLEQAIFLKTAYPNFSYDVKILIFTSLRPELSIEEIEVLFMQADIKEESVN